MLIDGHLDLAYNVATKGRDLTLPLHMMRSQGHGDALVTLPELKAGSIDIVFGTIFIRFSSSKVTVASVAVFDVSHGGTTIALYADVERLTQVSVPRGETGEKATVELNTSGVELHARHGQRLVRHRRPRLHRGVAGNESGPNCLSENQDALNDRSKLFGASAKPSHSGFRSGVAKEHHHRGAAVAAEKED